MQNDPFIMLKLSKSPLRGNEQYEGFTVDLLSQLSKKLGFKYTIKLVSDKSYGSYDNGTKLWNGMIREVLDKVSRKQLCLQAKFSFIFSVFFLSALHFGFRKLTLRWLTFQLIELGKVRWTLVCPSWYAIIGTRIAI